MNRDGFNVFVSVAMAFTANEVVKEVFKDYKLTSTLVSARELKTLQIMAVMNGLFAMNHVGERRKYYTDRYLSDLEFINAITTKC